ncbi:hypothetical protein [Methanobrevibacter sp.]
MTDTISLKDIRDEDTKQDIKDQLNIISIKENCLQSKLEDLQQMI